MPYRAALTRRFLRELRRQPPDVKERALKTIDEIISEPFSGTKLRGELEGRWRWRIGQYRIIYLIDDPHRLVVS